MALGKKPFSVAAAANATLFTGPGALYGIIVKEVTGTPAAGLLTVYDNTAASGAVLAPVRLGADGEDQFEWEKGVKFSTGLTVAATGADFNGMLLVGSAGGLRALPFAGADLLLVTGSRVLDSVLAAETAGAAAEWRLYDNTSITGTPMFGHTHTANETRHWKPSRKGVQIDTGLFYDQQSGAVSGAAYVY
jgi:hypothetical protein